MVGSRLELGSQTNLRGLDWRFKTKREQYSPSSFTAAGILPDAILTTLASHLTIKTLQDFETPILQQVDECNSEQHETKRQAQLDEAECHCVTKRLKEEEHAERQKNRLETKLAKELKVKLEKEVRKQEAKEKREVAAQARIAKAAAASRERAELRTPLAVQAN
ncbi:hypothetical protein BDQ17DRAFT_1430024 [Cyathus striatus]|nr:hypothetical protein BDQ17DRAFT_1430024 [Cyathus striatus]